MFSFFFSSRRRHTRCALVTGVQTCALPISDPELAAEQFVGMLTGRMQLRALLGVCATPDAGELERRVEHVVAWFLALPDPPRWQAAAGGQPALEPHPSATRAPPVGGGLPLALLSAPHVGVGPARPPPAGHGDDRLKSGHPPAPC